MPPNGPKAFLGHPSARRPAGPYARVPSGPRNGAAPAQARPQQQQQKRKSKGSSIMVSNLPGDVSNKDVVDLFVVTVGALNKCRLVHNDQGRFEGIALVDFVEEADALKAYTLYNNKMIDQQTPLKVSLLYTSPPPTPSASSSSNPLFNLAPFPGQQQNRSSTNAKQQPPKPKQLAARLGPAVVSLGDRLGPPPPGAAPSVVAKEVANGVGAKKAGAKGKKAEVLKKMKARGKKGKKGGAGGGAQAMVL